MSSTLPLIPTSGRDLFYPPVLLLKVFIDVEILCKARKQKLQMYMRLYLQKTSFLCLQKSSIHLDFMATSVYLSPLMQSETLERRIHSVESSRGAPFFLTSHTNFKKSRCKTRHSDSCLQSKS
jgi:hypothetical protein